MLVWSLVCVLVRCFCRDGVVGAVAEVGVVVVVVVVAVAVVVVVVVAVAIAVAVAVVVVVLWMKEILHRF